MTVLSQGVPLFFRPRPVPIHLVNQVSLASSGSPITFNNLSYGAYPTSRRLGIVCLSSQDGGNISNLSHDSVVWGGTSLFERTPVTARLAQNSSITVSIWSRFLPTGDQGNLVITHNKGICDSMGVATFVTTLADSEAPVDVDGSTDVGSTIDTINDIATAAGGFILAVGNVAYFDARFTSLIGNGGVGSMPELFDLAIEGDHRMGVWLKTGTPGGSTEDFTLTHDVGFSFSAWAIASWAGGT